MGLAKTVARPVYRRFFEKPLWWFLSIVKTFFMSEITARVAAMEAKIQKLEHLERIEAANAAQWDALEQLLLAMYRQPEARLPHFCDTRGPQSGAMNKVEPIQVNGPNTLR